MQYLGSKSKIAKKILPIILKGATAQTTFIDMFCGGANLVDKIDIPLKKKIAVDNDAYLISMWSQLQNGWQPPDNITKEQYINIRNLNKNPTNFGTIGTINPATTCFVGYLCSFGGKWWGGYAANSKGDNYAARAKRVLLKQIENLKDVEFKLSDYWNVEIPENSIVYCDPPYEGTTEYKTKFDHNKFWDWVRETSKKHPVYISEYNAPPDFKCLLEIPVKTVLDKNSQKPRVERLFSLL